VIPDDVVALVRDSADIVQIIGEHVALKRAGTDWRGPCPFHQGTHRNFSVSPKKGIYYCFVCNEGGDVFSFLQKRLGVDWPSAVRMVAAKSGVEVREVERANTGPDPREPLWEINAGAAAYFTRMLWEDDLGRPARAYLAQRGIERALADRFSLGFAPREIGLLRAYMQSLGYADDRVLESGLLVLRDDMTEPRPRFRNRLMFPIMDLSGHHVGFGGRTLGQDEPKYLNSADSSLFSKGRLLYGLHVAKQSIRRDERLVLVEGYFDLMRVVEAGIESVVASLGTALTEDQARLVARYTKHVVLLYDSDQAGLKATFRSGDLLLAQGIAVTVATLPEGEDPDTYARSHGRAGLESLLSEALDIFDRKLQLTQRSGWFADLRHKRRALDRLMPTIRATADPLTRDLYLARLSDAAGVTRALLERELTERVRGAPPAVEGPTGPSAMPPSSAPAGARGDARRRKRPSAPGASSERGLVGVMLHARHKVEQITEQVGPDDFWIPGYRRLFEAILERGADATVDEIAAELDPESLELMQDVLSNPGDFAKEEATIKGSVARILARPMRRRRVEINRELPLAGDADKDRLIREKIALVDEGRELNDAGLDLGKSHG
jgi:DNA primase